MATVGSPFAPRSVAISTSPVNPSSRELLHTWDVRGQTGGGHAAGKVHRGGGKITAAAKDLIGRRGAINKIYRGTGDKERLSGTNGIDEEKTKDLLGALFSDNTRRAGREVSQPGLRPMKRPEEKGKIDESHEEGDHLLGVAADGI